MNDKSIAASREVKNRPDMFTIGLASTVLGLMSYIVSYIGFVRLELITGDIFTVKCMAFNVLNVVIAIAVTAAASIYLPKMSARGRTYLGVACILAAIVMLVVKAIIS